MADQTSATADAVGRLVPWSAMDVASYGRKPLRAPHRLTSLDWFSDEALIALLDRYPRDKLQAFTMGTDPERHRDWSPVDTEGASGRDLFDAVSRGRLWYNVQLVHLVDKRYARLLEQLYRELADQIPGFRPERMSCTLIISSPTSQTYYHADAQPNLLWQVRGVKRLWVYPAGDPTLVAPQLMENIFASFADEEVPFQKTWDERAECIDLHPDEVICWPHNAPHRVVNIEGLNVSLSTIHETDETDRRKLIYCANRFFRNKTPLPFRSVREDGLGAYLKRQAFRTVRRAGLVHTPPRRVYLSDLRIDASAPLGWRKLAEGPVLTEFSRKDFRLSRDASGAVNVLPRTADA